MNKKRWSDLSATQQRTIALASALQLGLFVAALVDIYRRSEEEVRGSKQLWTLASFVNFVGPISYFLFGRKR